MIISDGLGRTKVKASDFSFARAKSWLGGDLTERIDGWRTYVYEAAGKMKTVNITKARWPACRALCHCACMRRRHAPTLPKVNDARCMHHVHAWAAQQRCMRAVMQWPE